jgi:hypothetical protein
MQKLDINEGRQKKARCLQAMDVEKTAQNTMDSKKDECIGD